MAKPFLNWTYKWLFKKMLPWKGGEQSAMGFKHQGNGQRRNKLELLAIKLAVFSFSKEKRVKGIHFQHKAALSYLLKMGGTKNKHMIKFSKQIWHYLLNQKKPIIAEYLPSVMNTVADRDSKKKTDSPEWLLHPKDFQAVFRLLGSPTINIFASRLCHHLPQYIAWHPDPCSQGTDAMMQNCHMDLCLDFLSSVWFRDCP